MLRWNRTLLRATALAAIVALGVGTVGGVVGLPGPFLLAALVIGVVIAVAVVIVSDDSAGRR